MMIHNIQQLNKFSARMGVKSQADVLLKLIERKEVITASVAKLV